MQNSDRSTWIISRRIIVIVHCPSPLTENAPTLSHHSVQHALRISPTHWHKEHNVYLFDSIT